MEVWIHNLTPQKGLYKRTSKFSTDNTRTGALKNLQKGFWDGIPGTIEHTELLTYIINHSRRKQRDMVITLLDLKNAFGEVSHDLLRMTLKFHHVPEEIISLINEFYADYHVSVGTKSFVTDPIDV